MTIQEAADKLDLHLRPDANIVAIGVSSDSIIIYVVKHKNYLKEWQGFTVKTKIMGKLEVKPSKKHGGGI